MAKKQRKYDMEYKIQAVKLAKEIGGAKAAAELGIPEDTLYAWMKAAREASVLDRIRHRKYKFGGRSYAPAQAGQGQEKEIRRLKEENEFLEEARAFFAASRRKSARGGE